MEDAVRKKIVLDEAMVRRARRLSRIETMRPCVVQNLGKYERHAWQTAEFK